MYDLFVIISTHYFSANQPQYIITWICKKQYQNPCFDTEQPECRDIGIKDVSSVSENINIPVIKPQSFQQLW